MPVPAGFDPIAAPGSAPEGFEPIDISEAYGKQTGTEKPSIASDALKYSPIGMVRGLADMIRTAASGQNPLAGMAQANASLLDKAKDSFEKGHYADAAAHFVNYLIPAGAAFEDVQNDIREGNYGHAAAKFAGLASNIPAASAGSAALDTATAPGAGTELAARVKAAAPDVASGAAKVAGGELLAKLPGMEFPARIAMGYPGSRQIATGIGKLFKDSGAPLSDRVTAAATAAAGEAADPLLDGIAQGFGYKKFSNAPADAQETMRGLAAQMRGESIPRTSPVPQASPGVSYAMSRSGGPAAQIEGPKSIPMGPVTMEHDPSFVRGIQATYPTKTMPGEPPPVAVPKAAIAPAASSSSAASSLSIAEQLRDEMLRNGSITEKDLVPPEESVITEAGKIAVADAMRQSPPEARVPMANAAYAGGAADDSALAGAVYEAAHRADKATKLAKALYDGGISAEDAVDIEPEHWNLLSKAVGVRAPSQRTIVETIRQLQELHRQGQMQDQMMGLGRTVEPMIRARDDQGNLHEAPSGTPLPEGWKAE